MADVLRYKTVTGVDGNTSIPSGLNLNKIIKVSRQGEQKDFAGFVSVGSLDGSNWTFISVTRRISFGTSFPFIGSEVIHIIYKT